MSDKDYSLGQGTQSAGKSASVPVKGNQDQAYTQAESVPQLTQKQNRITVYNVTRTTDTTSP